MNNFNNFSRDVWKEMREGTAFEQPVPDTGEYKADFYGSKIGEGIKFPQLIRFLHDTVVDSSLLFNWTAFAAPSSYTSVNVRDGEGGFIPRINVIAHNVPFVYTNENNQKIEVAIAALLNKRIDYLEEGWAFMLHLDPIKNYIAGSLCFYYENTEKYRKNASDTIDINDFRIAEKYIAVSLTSEDFTDFCALVEVIAGKREANYVRQQIAKKYVQKILGATSASELKFLYETIPDFAFEWIRPFLEFKLVVEHLSILKSYDDMGYFSAFRDSSGAIINLLRVLGDSKLVYHLFLNNPILVKELYQNMDGVSTIDGITQKNRMIFADFLYALSLSNQYQGAIKTGAVFKIGADYKLNSNVLARSDKFKDKIYLQQLVGEKEKKTLTPLEDIPRYKEQIEVDITTYTAENEGTYYDPLAAVLLMNMDEREGIPYQVPAIYVKAIDDEEEWQDIALVLRIGGNVLAIVLGIATLGSGSPLLIGLGLIDISLATTDTLIAVSQDPLMQTEEGREFLANWEKIYLAGSITAVGPLLVSSVFTTGVKLLNKAITTTTKNFLRSSLLRLVMELNIPNFTTHTLTVLTTSEEVSRTTSTVIRMSEVSRLQEAGVLFVKGEMVGGKAGKEGLVVVYKGEVLASGDAKTVRNSLDEVFGAKSKELVTNLENSYLRVNALRRWGDKIDPTFYNHLNGEFNTLLIESHRTGYKMEVLVSEGGHSSAAIGKTIRLKGKPIPNPPRVNQPYRTRIYVKYRDGWLEKEAMSSMFPSNWDLERIKQEIAFVYENTVIKNKGFIQMKNGISDYEGLSTNGFQIRIQIKETRIVNAFPINF